MENKLLETMHKIILHPDNARQLLNPLDSDNFKITAKELREIKGTDVRNDYNLYGDPIHHLQMSKQNMEGAGGIGIAANSGVMYIYAAKHDFGVASEFDYTTLRKEKNGENKGRNIIEVVSTKINLKHNKKENGEISLGGLKDVNEIAEERLYLYEVFNAYVSLTVDNAKDPILDDLNSGLKTINTVLYLAMAGVPYKTIHYFMNQPIILKYLENLEIYESNAYNSLNPGDTLFSDKILLQTIKEFSNKNINETTHLFEKSREVEYTEEQLKEMLTAVPKGEFAEEQFNILIDFIRYQRTATELGNAIKGIQYDTKSFGKSEVESMDLLETTQQVIDKGIITNYADAFGENGFIGAHKKTIEDALIRMQSLSIISRNNYFLSGFNILLKRLHGPKIKMGIERRQRILNEWANGIIGYFLQSKEYKLSNDSDVRTPMNTRVDSLFKGANSVPSRIFDIKTLISRGNENIESLNSVERMQYNLYKDNTLIDMLVPDIDPSKDRHYLGVASKRFDKLQADKVSEDWRVLLNNNDSTLGMDLIEFSIIQSGMQTSPMSFTEFIPFEIYSAVAESVLRDGNIDASDAINYSVQSYINNYINNDYVKKASAYNHSKV